MANRFETPNPQFSDPTGLPYAGGSLTFFASGTTTPLSTFQDRGLTIANTNPVVLDSAGRAGNVFLQNLAYKVILEDVNNNVIWTADPVYASDFSTVAQFQSGNGSPNGSVAGSAGSATIPASSYWDATNFILYVCTQTGNAAGAVWTAVNAASAAAIIPPPQGYITPVTQTPVITSDSIGATSLFYTPYVGNQIPIYNGTTFVPTVFSELQMVLTSNQSANGIYDLFVFNNGGVVSIGVGPIWSNVTAGSSARGTGAGTTQLTRVSGLLVNAVSMTVRNGSNTFTVAGNQGTYVGSILIDSAAGQVTSHRSWGQSRKWGVWNAYNRVPIVLMAGDSTGSYVYNTSVVRASNGNAANSITVLTGLAEEEVSIAFSQRVQVVASVSTSSSLSFAGTTVIGYGVNSTTAISGTAGQYQTADSTTLGGGATFSTLTRTFFAQIAATGVLSPTLGINTITSLEDSTISGGATVNVTYFGGQTNMALSTVYRG